MTRRKTTWVKCIWHVSKSHDTRVKTQEHYLIFKKRDGATSTRSKDIRGRRGGSGQTEIGNHKAAMPGIVYWESYVTLDIYARRSAHETRLFTRRYSWPHFARSRRSVGAGWLDVIKEGTRNSADVTIESARRDNGWHQCANRVTGMVRFTSWEEECKQGGIRINISASRSRTSANMIFQTRPAVSDERKKATKRNDASSQPGWYKNLPMSS